MKNQTIIPIHELKNQQNNRFTLKITLLAIVLSIIFLSFTTLDKAKFNTLFSFLSRTELIINNWKIERAYENGKDVTSYYDQFELDILKGGTFKTQFTNLGKSFEYSNKHSWTYSKSKQEIAFNCENNYNEGVYKITKLAKNEMWLKNIKGTTELHYISK